MPPPHSQATFKSPALLGLYSYLQNQEYISIVYSLMLNLSIKLNFNPSRNVPYLQPASKFTGPSAVNSFIHKKNRINFQVFLERV